jgi:hypothetical protein
MDPIEWLEFEKRLRKLRRADLVKVKKLVDRRVSETLEDAQSTVDDYVPYRDGYLQLEYRSNPKTGTRRGPYWYFRYHDGGKQHTLYIGSVELEEAKRRVDKKRGS